jgi:hypothetical protein
MPHISEAQLQNAHGLDCISALKGTSQKPFIWEDYTAWCLAAWAIWKTTNAFIYQSKQLNMYCCREIFEEEIQWLKYNRVTRKHYSDFAGWVDSFI